MIRDAIHKLAAKQELTQSEAYETMNEIMSGNASEAQIAAFLMGLRLKGETVAEIAGCARSMREKAIPIVSKRRNIIDTCGTGGDGSGTFNISTSAAIVASAAGAAVAKHGNRAVSSQSGSADVLRALGVNLDLSAERVSQVLDEVGITFLFAPSLHGAMKFAAPVRRDMGVRTIFNILGPLTNPAGARRQLLGVFTPSLTELMAGVLKALGSEHAMVVHGEGGIDEFSTLGGSRISELREGAVTTYDLSPAKFGFRPASLDMLKGGDPATNAAIIWKIVDAGESPQADIVCYNAAAALVVSGVASSIEDGLTRAREAVRDGTARKRLNQWIEATRS